MLKELERLNVLRQVHAVHGQEWCVEASILGLRTTAGDTGHKSILLV